MGQLIDIVMGNILVSHFAMFEARSFLLYQPTAIDENPMRMNLRFFALLEVCMETIKSSRHHQLKTRVRQLAYVGYVRTATFNSVRLILDTRTLTFFSFFSDDFVKFSKFFWFL